MSKIHKCPFCGAPLEFVGQADTIQPTDGTKIYVYICKVCNVKKRIVEAYTTEAANVDSTIPFTT